MQRAALYIRVSSEEQAIHGLSIAAQTETLDAWAQENKIYVFDHYIDAGISARKKASKRPELQRLLEDVKSGQINLIVFTKLDRWFRNIAEYYKVQEVLETYHVDWKTVQEDYDTSTASGRLKINIMLSVAQDEADRTGERIKAVFESKTLRNEPISGKVPLGYKIENKHIVINEETAPIAIDLFNKYIAIRSISSLRKYLMDTYGIAHSHTAIRVMLKNERYIGRAHDQENYCPALISQKTFDHVQEILNIRAQRSSLERTGRVYLFTGIVYCAECGNRLSGHVVAQKYIYYRCTRYEKLHLCQHKKRTSELVLEKWLLENLLTEFMKYNERLEAEAQRAKPLVDTARIRRKMEKLKDLYLNDLIERDIYEKDYTALSAELNAVTKKPVIGKPVNIDKLSDSLATYSTLSREGQKEFWSRTVRRIDITNEDVFSVTPI